MKIFILLSLLSFYTFAQNYVLWQAENEHFQDYTFEELGLRLGDSRRLLPKYKCNDKDEFSFFWQAVRENSKGDSLRVQLNLSPEQVIFKNGKFLTRSNEEVTDFSDPFLLSVADALLRIELIPEGAKLLRNLEKSFFPLVIAKGGNMFNPRDDQGRSFRGIYRATSLSIFVQGRMTNENVEFNNIGAGGTILWSPKDTETPSFVALIHEMYHAFDSIRGILDMRFVQGDNYESAFVSEYRAVYFENIARKFYGLKLRSHYGSDQTGPGVLDELGNPRWLPSPCLKIESSSNDNKF